MSNIQDVYLFLHGAPNILCFWLENFDGFEKLYKKKVNGCVYLFSCYGGKTNGKNNSVAWSLASKTNTKVFACNGKVSYSEVNNYYGKSGYRARSGFKDGSYGSWYCFYYKNGKRHSYVVSALWM